MEVYGQENHLWIEGFPIAMFDYQRVSQLSLTFEICVGRNSIGDMFVKNKWWNDELWQDFVVWHISTCKVGILIQTNNGTEWLV